MEKRKAFNFYRSYYEVAQELNDKERLEFYDAIMSKQFNNINPNLKGVVKFAYLSQEHSILKQIEGYYSKTKNEIFAPTQVPCQGGTQHPYLQEKGQEKEKEEEQYVVNNSAKADVINFDNLLSFFNKTFSKKCTVVNDKTKKAYKQRLKEGYTKEQILIAMQNVSNDNFHKEHKYKYATIEFFSRADKLSMYSSMNDEVVNEVKPKFRAAWD